MTEHPTSTSTCDSLISLLLLAWAQDRTNSFHDLVNYYMYCVSHDSRTIVEPCMVYHMTLWCDSYTCLIIIDRTSDIENLHWCIIQLKYESIMATNVNTQVRVQ